MMATDAANAPTNGYSHVNPYATNEQNFGSHQVNNSASSGYVSNATPSTNATQSSSTDDVLSKEEVAWYFVEQYYTTMSRNPEKLYLFFNKRSQFVSGVEEAKVGVCLGQKAILERIKDLEYQDCKVRVTNVDSQSSDANIVIQVIGEMSNKSQPHRKFVQTFILATQTNGYFVLNDIFRYIKEEDEEPEVDTLAAAGTGYREPSHTTIEPETSTKETITQEDVSTVDKKLEEVAKEEPVQEAESPEVNGTPVPEPEQTPAEEEPAAPVSAPEEAKIEEAVAAEEVAEPEKPMDPAPSPVPAPKASPKPAATPAAPPKPAMPKTWAQLASQNRATAAAAAASAPTPAATSTASPPKPAQKEAPSNAAPATSTQAQPVREPSPVDSQKEGSSGGWQTAGHEHSRKTSRAQAQPAVGQDGKVRAYVKNVYATVDADALKAALSKFGELAYFDVSRAKNSAFVEFANVAGFQAAVAANPHKFGNDSVYVEERRPAGQFNSRGGGPARGGRGGFEQRPGGQGRGGFGKEAPRGGFTGARGGRGGAVTPRGGRGAAQAA